MKHTGKLVDKSRNGMERRPLNADYSKRMTEVPAWLYDETICNYFTKASFLWWCNIVCAFFHFVMSVVTIAVTVANNGGMDKPTLSLYLTKLTWVPDATDALLPEYVKGGKLQLAWMTWGFFFLSFFFHFFIAFCNSKQAWGCYDVKCRRITTWGEAWHGLPTGWYFRNLHECRNPLRWAEYSISASLMIATISIASGVAHTYEIIFIFVLMFVTMTYGYFAEIMSPPLSLGPSTKPREWLLNDKRPELLVFPPSIVPARLQRLAPHLLGYFPYSAIWSILMYSFFSNTGDGDNAPPSFVYVIVISQMVVFTLFGLTQLISLGFDGPFLLLGGPSRFYWAEFSYQILSLLAKGILGMTLLSSVLVFGSFEDAVSAA